MFVSSFCLRFYFIFIKKVKLLNIDFILIIASKCVKIEEELKNHQNWVLADDHSKKEVHFDFRQIFFCRHIFY